MRLSATELEGAAERALRDLQATLDAARTDVASALAADPGGLQDQTEAFRERVDTALTELGESLAREASSAGVPDPGAPLQRVRDYFLGWIEGGGLEVAVGRVPFATAEELSGAIRIQLDGVGRHAGAVLEAWSVACAEAQAQSPAARLERLLAEADRLGVRLKKVPDEPTEAWLSKFEDRLQQIAAKQGAHAGEDPTVRLAALLSLAARAKVTLRKVPKRPSHAWLDKLETRLHAIAKKRNVPIEEPAPPTEERAPPTEDELHETPGPIPPREAEDEALAAPTQEAVIGADASGEGAPDPEILERALALATKAKRVGMPLGTLPPTPSEAWVTRMEKVLADAIAERKVRRKAERAKRDAARKARIERLQKQAAEHEIDLGEIPAFPTDGWFARAEQRIFEGLFGDERGESEEGARHQRLQAVLAQADELGVELDVPLDPDEVWLTWAEGRVRDAEQGDTAIAVDADPEEPGVPALVFEGGTLQERVWLLQEPEVTIGRARTSTIQIRDDAGVSRKHCTLFVRDGSVEVRDEGSTKGTFVDGSKVKETANLPEGATLVVGDTAFVLRV